MYVRVKLLKYSSHLFLILKSVAVVLTVTLLSCNNEIEEVNRVNKQDTTPSMYARDVSISESESGICKYKLTASLLKRFESEGKGANTIFPEGFKVVFFDSLNPDKIRTQITAEYGMDNEGKRRMEARSNVVVINQLKGEKLNTEELIWDKNTRKVYSDKFVTITTPDKIIYGEGLVSDERFERWTIKKPRGEMYVNDNL